MEPTPAGRYYRRRLPHWRERGATYFVTWRVEPLGAELAPAERTLVVETLRHFHGDRYDLLAYVVMNDHVHVLVAPAEGRTLDSVVHSWKSFTANRLQRATGRVGTVWQGESFDRVVRDEADLAEKAAYIEGNPAKRWPDLAEYEWVGFPGMTER